MENGEEGVRVNKKRDLKHKPSSSLTSHRLESHGPLSCEGMALLKLHGLGSVSSLSVYQLALHP
jgi:hypothetical protein